MRTVPHAAAAEPGTLLGGRLTLRERLGAGAHGVVFAGHDHQRGIDVAVKRLHHVQPTAIYRFKREFRALADLSHPHLVQL
jgi:serine/threonine protein kinase